jgi:hypothetical protein
MFCDIVALLPSFTEFIIMQFHKSIIRFNFTLFVHLNYEYIWANKENLYLDV